MCSQKSERGFCPPGGKGSCCCKVDSVVTVDERGQMVLPKEIREKAGIKAGEKLAVITWGSDDKAFCISLVKAEDIEGMVKDLLGPMMKDIIK